MPGAFDPDKVAAYQLQVFEAYDQGSDVNMIRAYVGMLREENKYSWVRAIQAGYHMARAHLAFRSVHSHYEQLMPDLRSAYAIERDWFGASFDPGEVSQAELNTWLASRDHPERVVDAMTEAFAKRDALRFNVSESTVRGPASLYARAVQMRDQDEPDWGTVASLLSDAAKAIAVSVRVR